jgi:hypothetical protein
MVPVMPAEPKPIGQCRRKNREGVVRATQVSSRGAALKGSEPAPDAGDETRDSSLDPVG